MYLDFETFKTEGFGFIKPFDKVELLGTTIHYNLSDKFKATFPILTKLIEKSRVLNLTINN